MTKNNRCASLAEYRARFMPERSDLAMAEWFFKLSMDTGKIVDALSLITEGERSDALMVRIEELERELGRSRG